MRVNSFRLFKGAGESELEAVLSEYGIVGSVPAGAGAYGQVYFGHSGYETLSRSPELLEEDSDRRSLRETLDWVRSRGILSGDIYEDNIMERPGTGE